MYKRLISSAISIFVCTCLCAVPAKRGKIQKVQSDGSVITVQLRGNEYFHYYVTDDGLPLVADDNTGDLYYGTIVDGQLQTTSRRAHSSVQRNTDERAFLARLNNSADSLRGVGIRRKSLRKATKKTLTRAQVQRNTMGEKRGLVILVNFKDNAFSQNGPKAVFNSFMNQVDYKENKQYGSVHDYFLAQSDNQFSLNFDVVGPFTLSNIMSYYGSNDRFGEDKYVGKMISEACLMADDVVDFSNYDWDGDGQVEQVYVIYAGHGEAQGAPSQTIWPHEWQLSESDYGKSLTLDGVTIDTYACSCELSGNKGTTLDGIGTTCHEFSHCLGLPDFYDTEGSNFGMDSWDILDYGSYGDGGNRPCGYTSYEKWFCGWQSPIVLKDTTSVTAMRALSEGGNAYIIYNDAYPNEYYLLENRQQTGWDASLNGHGLLVLHVDYDADVWENNTVNNTESHQRMTIIPADNELKTSSTSLAGDPFPGRKGIIELTDTSVPSASLYHANANGKRLMSRPLFDISEDEYGLISFNFLASTSTSKDLTGIAEIENEGRLDGINFEEFQHIMAERPAEMEIYTPDGMRRIYAASASELPKGIYLVRYQRRAGKICIK